MLGSYYYRSACVSRLEVTMEQKICKQCNQEFEVTDDDLEFYRKASPNIGDKTYEIPSRHFVRIVDTSDGLLGATKDRCTKENVICAKKRS